MNCVRQGLKGKLGRGSQAACIQLRVQLSEFPAMTVGFESSTGEKKNLLCGGFACAGPYRLDLVNPDWLLGQLGNETTWSSCARYVGSEGSWCPLTS